MKSYYVYILECADQSYYVGMTSDIERRFAEHQSGYYPNAYTFERRPLTLEWHTNFPTYDQAFICERQIKSWSRRKKRALITGRIGELKYWARAKSERRRDG